MKTIGLMGGMSWESSADYYRIINESVRERVGGHHSAKILLFSLDFAHLEHCQREGDWDGALAIMLDAAKRLERGGADMILICANTMHKLHEGIRAEVGIPVPHIADAVAEIIKARGLQKVGLLGTRYTMEQDFYRKRLLENHEIRTIIPGSADRETIQSTIYNELCLGLIKDSSRDGLKKIIRSMTETGAEGIILGCTEIPMLISQEDVAIPIFDTTRIHAEAAVDLALKD